MADSTHSWHCDDQKPRIIATMTSAHFDVSIPPGLADLRCTLGESPTWSNTEQALYWVDILACRIHRYAPAHLAAHAHLQIPVHTQWQVPAAVGCLGLRQGGGLVLALRSGLHTFNPSASASNAAQAQTQSTQCAADTNPNATALRLWAHPEASLPGNRMNDGKVSPDGRFFAGSMDDRMDKENVASLYRLDPSGDCQAVVSGLKVSNGLAWSVDGKTMYHSDSRAATVWAYDYDVASGEISRRRVFINYQEAWGRPDGATVDAEGCYWSAGVRAGRLNRFSPEGELMSHIALPVSHPTMPCFGGADLKTIYVTSLRDGMSPEALVQAPWAGAVLQIEQDVTGIAGALFAG
jgi:sugar lactone lactonase YvrE